MSRTVYPSLQRALTDFGIPQENHTLIQRICMKIGIERYEQHSTYINAVRVGAGLSLHINWGWTDGFESEKEVLDATDGMAPYVQSNWRKPGAFYVEHPVNRLHSGSSSSKTSQRTYGICPNCYVAFPATRTCDNCN